MRTYPSSSINIYILHLKPRRCAIVGYTPAGMRFNSISMRHTSDTFHVCYEVMSVNTAEPRCAMRNGNQRNTGKSVDCGLVTEQSVAGAVERSGIKKNKGKIAISSHSVSPFFANKGYHPALDIHPEHNVALLHTHEFAANINELHDYLAESFKFAQECYQTTSDE